MAGINGSELIVLIVIALLVLGPEKLPEYTRAFTQWLRKMRDMAEGAKTQFKEETGTDFDAVDWRKYDPRQYDPRRIIREALREPAGDSSTAAQRARELTGVSGVDLHGGLTRDDISAMDPRTLFRRPAGSGSTAVDAADLAGETTAAGVPGADVPVTAGTALASGAVVAGGAAAALMASGRAESVMALDAPASPAQRLSTDPDPLDLLGLAPAPFDVDAT